MNLRNDTHLYDRIGKKKRKRLMMSRELVAVLDDAVGPGETSGYVEEAVWRALIEDYGREAILAAIEDAQQSIDPENQLRQPRPVELDA